MKKSTSNQTAAPICLPSIVRYKDRESVATALLEKVVEEAVYSKNYQNLKVLAIAYTLLKESEIDLDRRLEKLQRSSSASTLRTVAIALDDKGYMYDTCPFSRRERTRTSMRPCFQEKFSQHTSEEQTNTQLTRQEQRAKMEEELKKKGHTPVIPWGQNIDLFTH